MRFRHGSHRSGLLARMTARRSSPAIAIGSWFFVAVAACGSPRGNASAVEPSSPATESAAVAVLLAAPVPATVATAPPQTFTMAARGLGETRRINVYTPPGYAARGTRVPVLYMPDGGMEEDFPHLTATVDRLIREGTLPPMLVVGIEKTERRRDLTGPTEVDEDRKIAPRVGGSAAFRAFVREELMPEVVRRYCTSADTAIIGESLAGLFIVETFLLEPAMFRRSAALSPSLWWNAERLAHGAPAQLAHVSKEPRALFVASAGDDILPGIERFAAALKASAPPQLRASYAPRPDLLHSNIYRSLSATALTAIFAWPPVEGGGACESVR